MEQFSPQQIAMVIADNDVVLASRERDEEGFLLRWMQLEVPNGKLVYENNLITLTRNEVSSIEFLQTSPESFARPKSRVETFGFGDHGGQHAEVLENFCDAIMSGAELIAPAEEGIRSVELGNAMAYSSLIDAPVQLPLDAEAYEAKLKELIAGGDVGIGVVSGDLIDVNQAEERDDTVASGEDGAGEEAGAAGARAAVSGASSLPPSVPLRVSARATR